MPNENESTTPTPLPVDEEIDTLLEPYPNRQELLEEAVRDDARLRFALARRLTREYSLLRRYHEEERAISLEYAAATSQISARIEAIEETFRRMALRQREAGMGNVLAVPGVGEVRTRKKAARWEVDNDTVLRQIDRESPFYQLGDPKPPEPKLRGQEFRRHLNELLDTIIRRGGDADVTPEELEELAKPIEEMFSGAVRYVREDVVAELIPEEGLMGG